MDMDPLTHTYPCMYTRSTGVDLCRCNICTHKDIPYRHRATCEHGSTCAQPQTLTLTCACTRSANAAGSASWQVLLCILPHTHPTLNILTAPATTLCPSWARLLSKLLPGRKLLLESNLAAQPCNWLLSGNGRPQKRQSLAGWGSWLLLVSPSEWKPGSSSEPKQKQICQCLMVSGPPQQFLVLPSVNCSDLQR